LKRYGWSLVLLALLLVVLGLRWLACDASDNDREGSDSKQTATSPGPRGGALAPASEELDEDGTVADGLTLAGRVIYPDGRAAAGASVRLLSRPNGAPHASMPRRVAIAASDGTFAFAKQSQGDYLLEAQTDDAVSPTTPARLEAGSEPVTLMVFPAATLDVRVQSAVDHKPIAGASVKLGIGIGHFGASDAYMLERSDASGVARFRGVGRLASHPVYAVADGFAGTFDNIRASEHLLSEWDIVLELQPGGAVSGRVVDEKGVGIQGAKVGWEPGRGEPDGSYTFVTPLADGGHYIAAVTDSNGAFRKTVPPGIGCLVAVHPSHLTGQACGVRSTIGQPNSDVTIVMKSGARISGVVVTARGEPAPRAEVIVTVPSWEHIPRMSDSYRSRTTTDAGGRFSFDGVDRMPLALTAWTNDASSELVEIDLTGTDERRDVRITLANTGVITGTVTEEDGGPAPFAIISYFAAPELDKITFGKTEADTRGLALPKSIGGTLCDAEGKFRIAGLPPSPYTVRAQRPSPTSVSPEYSIVWRYNVSLGSNLTLVLPGLGAIKGRVVDENGSPLSSFTVASAIYEPAMQTAPMPPGRPVSSPDGTFTLDSVPANRYLVAIAGSDVIEWRSGGIEVRAGAVTDLGTIKVAKGVAITGRVLTRAGDPVPNADVAMASADKPDLIQHGETDAGGRFRLPVITHDIAVKLRASTEQNASDWVNVAPGITTMDLVMKDPTRGTVRGVLIDPDHSVADRAVLITLPGFGVPGETLKPEATTSALESGRFVLDNVPAGAYLLWVRRASNDWVTRAIAVEGAKETSLVIDLSQEPPP
jgi:hypothetical protein